MEKVQGLTVARARDMRVRQHNKVLRILGFAHASLRKNRAYGEPKVCFLFKYGGDTFDSTLGAGAFLAFTNFKKKTFFRL